MSYYLLRSNSEKYGELTRITAWHSSITSKRIVCSGALFILQTQAKAPRYLPGLFLKINCYKHDSRQN